jgi:hypothetical protein
MARNIRTELSFLYRVIMNNIKFLQDKPENLKLMAAQRVAYQRAKGSFARQVIFTVAFAVLFNFVRLIPKDRIEVFLPYIVLFSVTVSLVDVLYFLGHISRLRTSGAKIQEEFDTNVYEMSWNKVNSGSKADRTFINEQFKRYKPNPESPIENWYDIDLNGLVKERAVLLCQETNLWYDATLRAKFMRHVKYVLAGLITASVLMGMLSGLTLGLFILYLVAPLLPAIVLTIKIYKENEKAISLSDELRKEVLALKQLPADPTKEQLRQIQDKIFCNRKDGPLIPEQFYRKQRQELEEGMKINASGQ